MPACHPDSLMPCRGSWHFCWIATVFCVVSRSGPHARAGSGYFPPGDGRWRVAPISRLDLVVSMLRGRPETAHCVPQGALYCRETTPFLCFSYKFLVPATRVVCDHEAVNRAQGEKDAGDCFPPIATSTPKRTGSGFWCRSRSRQKRLGTAIDVQAVNESSGGLDSGKRRLLNAAA